MMNPDPNHKEVVINCIWRAAQKTGEHYWSGTTRRQYNWRLKKAKPREEKWPGSHNKQQFIKNKQNKETT